MEVDPIMGKLIILPFIAQKREERILCLSNIPGHLI